MRLQLLGGLSAKQFLSHFWQKKPLLVRQAIPHFKGVVQAPELLALAARDEIESRLVQRKRGAWRLDHGPFSRSRLARLPARDWTLLVQGLNLAHPEADALLRRFRFLPYARLDDVMVSYAAPGGGVGPHFDSYDVFLLQGPGRRRWSIGRQRNKELVADAPLKILRRFVPEHEWLLQPGDMLYLPPGWAHDGVASEPCLTYSIGFRAPANGELAREFLSFLQDHVPAAGLYADPGLFPARHPARIPPRMIRHAAGVAGKIRWRRRDIARFLGEYLSTPKPQVAFRRPSRPSALPQFAARCKASGLALDPRTQMLFDGGSIFINGERVEAHGSIRRWLIQLADDRALPARAMLPQPLLRLLHGWYLSGWCRSGKRHG